MQENALTKNVDEFIRSHALISDDARILVAVSGGADSVAMLHILKDIAAEAPRKWHLTVVHLDHALRDDSAADAQFVTDLAGKLKIDCICERIDVAALANADGVGTEEAARNARYTLFAHAANETHATHVALAHHTDDNVETILHRILRGTHLRGLAGMPLWRKLEHTNARLVRPMLNCTRADIETYCRNAHIQWQTDQTNTDTQYTRNFIRHELLPLIRERINPGADAAITRLATAAADAESTLTNAAAALFPSALIAAENDSITLDATVLANIDTVVRRYVMRSALERLGVPMQNVTADTLQRLGRLGEPESGCTCESACSEPASAVNLPADFVAKRQADTIVIAPAPHPYEDIEELVHLEIPGTVTLANGKTVTCSLEPFDADIFAEHCQRKTIESTGREIDASPEVFSELLAADRISGKLICRTRKEGDSFRPLGCAGRQSVSDFLTNLKIPRKLRHSVRCICDDGGIICLTPLRIDQRVRITTATTRVVRVEIRNQPDSEL